ncbi:MAG: response regulator transcription factor [Arenicellales bacterium]|nr:response regulator transcription factor [Arenicellales bacterium]
MRVLLIDDHALFRVGLQGLLERRGIEILMASDGRRGIATALKEQPDVVLLDLRMPDMSGVGVLRELKAKSFAHPIVVLTTSEEDQDVANSLKAGASGYLLKDMDPDELVTTLSEIVKGETVVAPRLARLLADLVKQGSMDAEASSPFESLTAREFEILGHLAEGQSNKVIARHLNISDGTVKLHVKAILRKLDVHSRVEAAVMAVENGIRYRPEDSS